MKVFVDNENRIKDVHSTENATLREVYLDETAEDFPFNNKSIDYICSFKITADENGIITMHTPYVDSKALPHIDEQGKKNEDLMTAAKILLGEVEV